MPKLSEQTKITRAIAFGMLANAHPDELKVLHFLAQQPPPRVDKASGTVTSTGYKWTTGGKTGDFMSVERWAVLLGIHDRQAMHRALKRLWDHGLLLRDDEGSKGKGKGYRPRQYAAGSVATEWRLSPQFVEAAADFIDHVWNWKQDGLAILVMHGIDPAEHYENRHGMNKIRLPRRSPREPRTKASDRAEQRWSL